MSQVAERSPLELGREAASRHAWRDAFDHFRTADSQSSLGPEDLEGLAEAAWWSGRLEDCISARERAYALYLEADQPRRAAVVALSLADDYFAKLANSIGAGWFNRAERLLENEGDCVEQGYLASMQAHGALMAGDLDAGLEAAVRTLEIGMRFGDRDLQGLGLLLQGKVLVSKGDVEDGLAMLDEATVAAVGGELGPYASGIVYCVAISTTAELADYDRAGQWTEASRRWCERQSISGFPGVCRVHRAEIMRLRGSWIEAEQEARRALTELKPFNLLFAAEGFYELGEVRLRMGDLPGAEDAFRQAHELGREPQPGLALLRLSEGNVRAAFNSIKRVLDDDSGDRLHRARLIPGFVETALAADETVSAREAVEELGNTVETYQSNALKASYLSARGMVELKEGDARSSIKSLREALKMWKKAELPYEAARARVALASALDMDGDNDGAIFELRAARSSFEELGAALDLKNVSAMLEDETLAPARVKSARTTKTFMFTDIVGSTNLAEALGDDAWGDVLAWHDNALRSLFERHGGEEIKQTGDGFFVAFDTPNDAVECAVGIQRELAEHRRKTGFAPRVRIGLHSAEATRKGRDYEGREIHAAARIGAQAEGGEILASTTVVDAARIRFPVSDPRTVSLKGLSSPIAVASIAAD
jgi:class 3 adenylate cyclase